MAIYSSLMWLARKESLLSSLAQDLVDHDKNSPVVSSSGLSYDFLLCSFDDIQIAVNYLILNLCI